jgi:hypothetical protein
MTESIKQRTNSMANHRDAEAMRKLLSASLTDLQALRSKSLGVLTGSAVYDAASLLDAVGVTTTVNVTGALLGDFVVSVSLGVDLAGITVTGYVSAADTVSVRIQNESGGTLDLASTTIRVAVLPQASDTSKIGMLVGAATYDTASLVDAAGATATITVKGAALGDYCLGSCSLDLQGFTATWYVSATDTVSVRIQNESGATVDLASATLRCRVLPEASFGKVDFIAGTIGHLKGSATFDYADGADGVGETTTVTVTGAVLGDFAIVAHGVDLQGVTMTAYVSAADTVSVRFQNESAGTRTLASATLNARVIPQAAFPAAMTLNILA